MWNGKNKAVTFSYDDGTEHDIRLVEIFNRYGMKCTFNLNSGLMNEDGGWLSDKGIRINRLTPDVMPELYKGHEIAVHCAFHSDLTKLDDDAVRQEILSDKAALSCIFGKDIRGMAYPYGAFDERIISLVRECGIEYSRTCCDSHGFDVPEELLAYPASCRHRYEGISGLIDEFLACNGERPAVLCIWGHSYEFALDDNWELIEDICRKLAFRDDIFYGTNSEVYLTE